MTRPVLIIEDDPDIAEGLRYNLEREGLEARVAETGEQGLQAALDKKNPPALILLDLMLPGMTGTELCRRLRREPQTRRTPIIMLTARGAESERVAGLELGADDYITKPFSVRELIARVRPVLRRADETATARYDDSRLLTQRRMPQPNGVVYAPGRQNEAVWRVCKRSDPAGMP